MLSTKIDLSDYLAVSFITAAGDTVGSFPETDNPARGDSLELIVQPRVQATLPTFRYEMRQVYRIAGADLDRSSLRLGITVNRSERPIKPGQATYLAQLGLSVPTDANLFDVDNRVFPRVHDPVPEQVIERRLRRLPQRPAFRRQYVAGPAGTAGLALYHATVRTVRSGTSRQVPAANAVQLDGGGRPGHPRPECTADQRGHRGPDCQRPDPDPGRRLHAGLRSRPGHLPQPERPLRRAAGGGDSPLRGTRGSSRWPRPSSTEWRCITAWANGARST